MTNPNNAIGTNGAFGGRTSVNAFNDGVAPYSTGILSGWACEPSSGLTVILGGDGNTRDVAIAEDNAGNKTTINNISGSPVSVTIGSAPNNNSRIDSIVAYVNNPPTGTSTATDNYGACGLIIVAGTVSSTPSAPSKSAIRAAITADGASGTTAYYVVLANITISSGTTDLTSDNIVQDSKAQIGANNIDFTTLGGNYSLSEVDTGFTWVNGKHIYKKTIAVASSQITANSDNDLPHGISNFDRAIAVIGHLFLNNGVTRIATGGSKDHRYFIGNIDSTKFTYFSTLGTAGTYYFTFWYIKSN